MLRVDIFNKYFREQNALSSRKPVSYTFAATKSVTWIY